MLILAFDTATDVATSALVSDGEVLGERVSRREDAAGGRRRAAPAGARESRRPRRARRRHRARELHGHADRARRRPRARARARDPAPGVSTLDALAAGRRRAFPVIDARRGEVFVAGPGSGRARRPRARRVALRRRRRAPRYRDMLEARGGVVPADDDPRHVPHARLHARLARRFGPADEIEPLYVRAPDARPMATREAGAAAARPSRTSTRSRQIERVSYPDAVVALDVRGRAREAELALAGAVDEHGVLVGYVVLSRYVDAWHVMNVAVEPEQRRSGVASASSSSSRRHARRPAARLHARGAGLEHRRDPALRALRLHGARRAARLLHRQSRGRPDHVARRRSTSRTEPRDRADPRHRDVVRRDGCRGGRPATGRVLASVVSSQADLHAPLRRRGPGGRLAPAPGAGRPRASARPSTTAGVDARRRRPRIAVTQGPGLVGALLVGLSAAKAIAWSRGLAARPRRPSARARRDALPRSPSRVEPPFICLLASGGHTLLLAVTRRARVRGARRDARRRRRARRSTRARGCSGSDIPAARSSTGSRATATPTRISFPVARVPGLDFSFSGLKTALLYAVRELDEGELARAPGRSRRVLPARHRARARRAAPGGGRADRTRDDRRRGRRRRQLASCARRCRRRASRRSRSAPTTPRWSPLRPVSPSPSRCPATLASMPTRRS